MSRVRSFSVSPFDAKSQRLLANIDEHKKRKHLDFSAIVLEALQLYANKYIEVQQCPIEKK